MGFKYEIEKIGLRLYRRVIVRLPRKSAVKPLKPHPYFHAALVKRQKKARDYRIGL